MWNICAETVRDTRIRIARYKSETGQLAPIVTVSKTDKKFLTSGHRWRSNIAMTWNLDVDFLENGAR